MSPEIGQLVIHHWHNDDHLPTITHHNIPVERASHEAYCAPGQQLKSLGIDSLQIRAKALPFDSSKVFSLFKGHSEYTLEFSMEYQRWNSAERRYKPATLRMTAHWEVVE